MRPCDVSVCFYTATSLFIIISVTFIQVVLSEKCYKDETIGDRDGNVYHCESSGLPRCCVEDAQPSCCISESEKNWKDQLQLWGMVAAMILIIITLFICCKNDVSFCNNDTSLKERWQNFRQPPNPKDATLVNNDPMGTPRSKGYYDNPLGGFDHGPGSQPDPYRFPPPTNSYDPYA